MGGCSKYRKYALTVNPDLAFRKGIMTWVLGILLDRCTVTIAMAGSALMQPISQRGSAPNL
jgi:hypothetical protein